MSWRPDARLACCHGPVTVACGPAGVAVSRSAIRARRSERDVMGSITPIAGQWK